MRAASFNFSEPAELYTGGSWRGRPTGVTYQRFGTAAEAIRYVVEELPGTSRLRSVLEVNEDRFNHSEIQKLYDSSGYPLTRSGEHKDAT
jgi:hypothetical protein